MEAKEITFATADCHLVLYVVNTEYEINPVIAENRSLLWSAVRGSCVGMVKVFNFVCD